MSGYADIIRDPMSLYTQAAAPTTVQLAMEALENSQGLQKFGDGSYEPNAQVFLESVCEDERDVEDEVHEAVGMGELHRGNIQRLLENSAVEMPWRNSGYPRPHRSPDIHRAPNAWIHPLLRYTYSAP